MKKELEFEAFAVIDQNTAYASSRDFNALFKVDLNTYQCEFISLFENESLEKTLIHSYAIYYEGRVYFIPSSGECLSVYNIEYGELRNIYIPSPKSKYSSYKKKYKFGGGVILDNKLWMIPSSYPGIIMLDLETESMQVFSDWLPVEGYWFRKGICIKDNRCFVPSVNNDCLLEFDFKSYKGKIHHLGYQCGFWGMCRYKEDFWLSPRNEGPVVSWNEHTGKIKTYNNYPDVFLMNRKPFTQIYEDRGKLYFLPDKANMFLVYEIDKNHFHSTFPMSMEDISSITYLTRVPEGFYVKLCGKNSYGIVNIYDHIFYEKAFLFEEGKEKLKRDLKETNVFLKEGKIIELSEFLEVL